jgi:hypothetical protein
MIMLVLLLTSTQKKVFPPVAGIVILVIFILAKLNPNQRKIL